MPTKPHKCPKCDGNGEIDVLFGQGTTAKQYMKRTCPACQGECIVWEPEPYSVALAEINLNPRHFDNTCGATSIMQSVIYDGYTAYEESCQYD